MGCKKEVGCAFVTMELTADPCSVLLSLSWLPRICSHTSLGRLQHKTTACLRHGLLAMAAPSWSHCCVFLLCPLGLEPAECVHLEDELYFLAPLSHWSQVRSDCSSNEQLYLTLSCIASVFHGFFNILNTLGSDSLSHVPPLETAMQSSLVPQLNSVTSTSVCITILVASGALFRLVLFFLCLFSSQEILL